MKIIVTLGPSTHTEQDLRKIKDRGVDFVRINMSHSTTDDLRYFIGLVKKVGIPFIVDTEGSQIRTGNLVSNAVFFEENERLRLYASDIVGDKTRITIRPHEIIPQLEEGDLLYLDFDTLVLRVLDTSPCKDGYVEAIVVTSGTLGKNKGVVVDSATRTTYDLPPLTPKDYESIEIGLAEGVGHIAASFMRSGAFVRSVREASKGRMKIISKIECVDGLQNLDDIIKESDYLLIDRGDLSKEISIERIPFTQKAIIARARERGVGAFVATNLLETMIEKKKPTRAEVHDVQTTILDGAEGLTLSAETGIGKYPLESINMMCKLIAHTKVTVDEETLASHSRALTDHLARTEYLRNDASSSHLIEPHGGKLVERIMRNTPDKAHLDSLPKVALTDEQYMDAEQIAIGTFSPLEGFMGKRDLESVLDEMRLSDRTVWPLPIVLDVSEEDASRFKSGSDVVLTDAIGNTVAVLHLEEKYTFDKEETAKKLYNTTDGAHPGVRMVRAMKPVLLGGTIDLIKRRNAPHKAYEITPKQARRLFEERGWAKVVGFHTRNVIHRSHEFIQLKALEDAHCDGLFVHPVIGKKKTGDFHTPPIIKSYELMAECFYPKDKVVFATYSTFSRYAGPREALFTALCRKNFGCSHFVVGRDHTGVGNFYHPKASHEIFDQFPAEDIGIVPVKFDKVFYSDRLNAHVHERDDTEGHKEEEKWHISGTEARNMLLRGEQPPAWFMRPEISEKILEMVQRGEEVFVE